MLKRFMNWLLYRLQKALGAISGQRKGNRSGTVPRVRSTPEAYKTQERGASELGGDSPSIATSGSGDSEPSPFIEASQDTQAQSTVNKLSIVNPAIAEPDTHRRLNASSAALPGVETAVPSFPTDVSELLPSSPQGTNLPASDEELPAIHDLLPAVENDSPKAESLVDRLRNDEVEEVKVSSSGETDDAEIVSASTQTPLGELTPVASTPSSGEISELTTSPAPSTSNLDELPPQAVLFSFDIIESDNLIEDSASSVPAKESVSGQTTVQTSPTLEATGDTTPIKASTIEPSADNIRSEETSETLLGSDTDDIGGIVSELSVIETGDSETGELIAGYDTLESSPAERDAMQDSALLADADKPLEALSDVTSSELNQPEIDPNKDSVESSREIEPLPYPWSLAVPKQGAKPIADTLEKTDAVFSSDNVKSQETEPVAPERDKLSVSASSVESFSVKSPPTIDPPEAMSKNGVVKLLFTLKPGNFHGYIVPNDGTQDILFHQKYINSDVFERLERGAHVVVSVKHIEGKAYATNVDLL